MASPNISEILTTTLQEQSGEIADAVLNNIAFYYRLKKQGRIKKVPGGYELREPIYYDDNSTAGWYSGYEELDISPQDVITAANYPWKQGSTQITASGLELRQNAESKAQLIDLMDTRMEVAKKSWMNLLETGLFSDGSGSSGKQINGLQLYVSSSPSTGTVGGISRVTWSFWRNIQRSTLTSLGVARSASNILSETDAVYNQLVRGTDKPTDILCDNTDFGYYLEATRARQVFTKSEMADAGFESIRYRGADITLCGGVGGAGVSGSIFILNSGTFNLKVHSDCWMTPLDPDRHATNQDGVVKIIASMLNLTMNNSKLNGLLN